MHLQDCVTFKESVYTVTHVTLKDIRDHKDNLIRRRSFLAHIFNVW